MKIVVISYSLTGNNETLANRIAKELAVEHIIIKEAKPRTIGSIILDLILNRTPKVQPTPDKLENYDLIIMFGPIWMGKVATPLRTYLKNLNKNQQRYAYISISGGADGVNPKLAGELNKIAGEFPVVLLDLHIADLLPSGQNSVRKETSAYKITQEDINKLSVTVMKTLMEANL